LFATSTNLSLLFRSQHTNCPTAFRSTASLHLRHQKRASTDSSNLGSGLLPTKTSSTANKTNGSPAFRSIAPLHRRHQERASTDSSNLGSGLPTQKPPLQPTPNGPPAFRSTASLYLRHQKRASTDSTNLGSGLHPLFTAKPSPTSYNLVEYSMSNFNNKTMSEYPSIMDKLSFRPRFAYQNPLPQPTPPNGPPAYRSTASIYLRHQERASTDSSNLGSGLPVSSCPLTALTSRHLLRYQQWHHLTNVCPLNPHLLHHNQPPPGRKELHIPSPIQPCTLHLLFNPWPSTPSPPLGNPSPQNHLP